MSIIRFTLAILLMPVAAIFGNGLKRDRDEPFPTSRAAM